MTETNPRRKECPFIDGAWIQLPPRWLGVHAARRDRALEQAREKKLGDTLSGFAVAMALLEEWSLPGLMGNPEQWDYELIDLNLIAWIRTEVMSDFLACLLAPATYSKRFGDGQAMSAIQTPNPVGTSEPNG